MLAVFAAVAAMAQEGKDRGPSATANSSDSADFTFKISANLPNITFKVIPDPEQDDEARTAEVNVREIEVFRGDSHQVSQRLRGCDFSHMQAPSEALDWFQAEDFNFDGYLDIYLITSWGATGNHDGCIWLYNPSTRQFEYNEDFSKISPAQVDPATKTLLEFEHGGMAGMVFEAEKYKVEDNRPILVWSESQDWDSGKKQLHCTVQQRRGIKMETVRDVWAKPMEGEPCHASRLFKSSTSTK